MFTRPYSHPAMRMAITLALCATASAYGQAPPHAAKNVSGMQFMTVPPLPTCATASVQSGDPGKGPSFILAKLKAGCVVPWHWHTPSEYLMMVSGVGRAEMKDLETVTLQPGGFALMPSKHVHQFSCIKACTFYIHSDAAFDMHYVDAQGKELTPDDALKAVKETAAKPGK
jgi:quercetin dioxygenase-like cupin family protein